MRNLVVVTKPDQVSGYRLAGINAIGVEDALTVKKLVSSWLNNHDQILLALADSLFSMLGEELVERLYASNDILLVTIPDGPVSEAEQSRKERMHNMIRHATGVNIRFKGEGNGTN